MAQNVLKDVIPKVLGQLGVSDKNYAALAVLERELESFLGQARVAGMKNNKIYIEMGSSAHLQEASLRRRELLKSVSSFFPKEAANPLEIKFFLKGTERTGGKFTRIVPPEVPGAVKPGFKSKYKPQRFYKRDFTENEKTD